ncbi:MAG: type II toxin-antitoxin system RelE/ParE family toxin [Alphaproteobacteria bacterium]|nr:MAG: type II toxin-antitoxin system RelE/ParE family toxin [Alphaproteobacteria bacterium]
MTPKVLNVTGPAKRDVADIHHHIAQHDTTAADRLVLSLYAHFDRIAATGHSGVPRDNIRPGLRLATHGRYNIYFRVATCCSCRGLRRWKPTWCLRLTQSRPRPEPCRRAGRGLQACFDKLSTGLQAGK